MSFANYNQDIACFFNNRFCFIESYYVLLACSLLIAYIVLYLGYHLLLTPFSKIPGPRHSKISTFGYYLDVFYGTIGKASKDNYYKYGDIYTLGPNAVAISNPADCRRVLGSTDFTKHPAYAGLAIEETIMISTLSEEDAHARHKRVGLVFSHTNLAKVECILIDHGVKSLFKKWDSAISQAVDKKAAVVNYAWDFMAMSFDVACGHVYGQQFDMLNGNQMQVVEWMASYRSLSTLSTSFGGKNSLLVKWLAADAIKGKAEFFAFTSKLTTKRRKKQLAEKAPERGTADVLDSVLMADNQNSGFKLSANQATAEVTAFLVANSGSTSETMCWTLHHMLLNPITYHKAVLQARSAFSHSHTITYRECKAHLPYIEACIYESMRIHAISGSAVPRVVPKQGITIQGHFLPQGTTVAVNIAGANHHQETWTNPRAFLPERFVDNPAAKQNVFAFSHGARSCPGRNLALRQMIVVFANMLKNYDFELPEDALFKPGILDKHGYPQVMPSVQSIMIGPKYPERDCRIIVRKAASNAEV
ncbi:hypothetical protein GGF40_002240 [Coemansia sp. RSA 1286]|nr:hypothetical protein GGF40_002240 [Coemansia sp. RSA 1286]